MDDFLILTKTRWHLRKAIKKLNQFFNQFSIVQHPDKTFIGKIDKDFDWMGFQITMQGIVAIAPRSMDKLIIKLAQLYERNQPLLPIVRALNYFRLQCRPLLAVGISVLPLSSFCTRESCLIENCGLPFFLCSTSITAPQGDVYTSRAHTGMTLNSNVRLTPAALATIVISVVPGEIPYNALLLMPNLNSAISGFDDVNSNGVPSMFFCVPSV